MDHMVHSSPLSSRAATWVTETIEARGISLRQLSDGTGIARPTLTRRLNGADFTINELERIAKYLGVQTSTITAAAEDAA